VDGEDINGWEGCVLATEEINEEKILVGRSRNVGRIKCREAGFLPKVEHVCCYLMSRLHTH
jgi:hypothetical protein